MTIDEFAEIALLQRPASQPWTPVTDYSEAARRQVEGPHAQLILDTFRPARILDVGCGPGYLVKWLNEAAGHTIAYGADVRSDADYWLDITDRHVSAIGGDLVICREVLEHLTLWQIRKAVTNLCALSTRFVYATTRLSSEHDLLHVEQSDTLDPTHITLAAKDLYRLLFTLEGFRHRADLESKMDWKHLNRCLVYERAV